jgi:hypothetical protein
VVTAKKLSTVEKSVNKLIGKPIGSHINKIALKNDL